jgi:hypothetical protein
MKLLPAIKFLLIFLLFSGMSCEENFPEPTFLIGSKSEFRINQRYYSTDGNYTFIIHEIGDSRCPEGVVCVWQGEISVKGEWTENKTKSEVELHSVLTDLQKMPNGIDIQIIDAKPYPRYGTVIKPENKIITLVIQKR